MRPSTGYGGHFPATPRMRLAPDQQSGWLCESGPRVPTPACFPEASLGISLCVERIVTSASRVPAPETEAQERPAHEGGDDAHLRAMLDGVRIGTWQMELPQEVLRLSQMSASLLGLPEASLATFGELLA